MNELLSAVAAHLAAAGLTAALSVPTLFVFFKGLLAIAARTKRDDVRLCCGLLAYLVLVAAMLGQLLVIDLLGDRFAGLLPPTMPLFITWSIAFGASGVLMFRRYGAALRAAGYYRGRDEMNR